jgi:xylulokinase
MANLMLGLDIGTSGTKALLLNDRGKTVATATATYENLMPKPGWSEQRPADWWAAVRKSTRAALRTARASKTDVASIGVAGQMHGSVFLNRQDQVLCNALLWNDQRTEAECREIETRAGGRDALIGLVQNAAMTGFQAPKILWLRNQRRGLFRRVRSVLLPKDYINFMLTGVRATDVSDASGTLLLDIQRRDWSDTLLERLEIDRAWLPPVHESFEVIGTLTAAAARHVGLRAGLPVVAGAGDQAAAAVGTGIVRSGNVSATIGTSGVVFAHSDTPVPNDDGLLQSFCHAVPGRWCVFGCMLAAGGSLQWAREVLYADQLAAARTDTARDAVYTRMIRDAAAADYNPAIVFHPYLTGERCPYPHPHAHGAFIGTARADTRGTLVRAVLEGITLGMGQQIELMQQRGVPVREVRLTGGGSRNPWWRQLQADIYGVKCVAMQSEEGSALGAAMLGGVGAGVFKSVPEAAKRCAAPRETLRPRRKQTERYAALGRWMRATYERLEPLYRGAER